MWDLLRDKGDSVHWKFLIWNSKFIPRQSFITWMLFQGRLSTRDRLASWGIISDGKCSFCNEQETMNHLFFQCDFWALWRLILQKCNMYRANRPWNEETIWCIEHLQGKSFPKLLCKLALQNVVAVVWYERNARSFGRTPTNLDRLYFQVVSTMVHRANILRKIRKSKRNWLLSVEWGMNQHIFED